MSSYSQCYPTLRTAAGSDSALLSKFPFLCKIETMAEALSNSNLIGDSRKNPNGYDKFEMAEAICTYLDTHMDYATGKIPSAIVDANNNKYIMSQPKYWDNLNSGLYTIIAGPGFGATAVAKTSGGHHYLTAPTGVAQTPTGSNPRAATFSTTLYTSSFVEYVDSGVAVVDPRVDTTNTGITSDDIRGISWEVENLEGTDTSGNTLTLDGWHYPMGIPGVSQIGIGDKNNFLTSNQVADKLGSPTQTELNSARDNGGYTGSPTLKNFGVLGSTRITPYVHFAPDAGFTNKVNSLTGGAGDIAPEYKFVATPLVGVSPTFSPIITWERAAGVGVLAAEVFDIYSMVSTDGDTIPSGANITGLWDGSTWTIGTVFLLPVTGDNWSPNSATSGRLAVRFDGITEEVETYIPSGVGNDQTFYGIPYYEIRIRYTVSSIVYVKTFYVPFHYLATYNIAGTPGGADMAISLANETAGITGDCTAQYNSGGTLRTATAKQGPFSVDTMSVLDGGSGYAQSDTITPTFPIGDGRHYQKLSGGGALLSQRSNNNPALKNATSRATATATTGALPRPYEIITHGSQNMGIDSEDYLERGFLGTDYLYEKDEWAKRFTLDNNYIDGISDSDGTDNATPGSNTVPGYEYSTTTYHDEQNPHGSSSTYMDVPNAGSGEDSEVYYDKSSASFDVAISNGRVTGFTARSRDDAEGTATLGGWGYSSNADYTPLTFIRDNSVSLPAGYIEPKVFIRTNTAADNGSGNKATIDINNADLEFYPGKNVPDGAFTYGFAFASDQKAYVIEPDQVSEDTQYYDRNWGRGAPVEPSSVRIEIERPTLTSTTRSLKALTIGTGAHRYTFELEYPPMTQDEAEYFIALFDEFKGPTLSLIHI